MNLRKCPVCIRKYDAFSVIGVQMDHLLITLHVSFLLTRVPLSLASRPGLRGSASRLCDSVSLHFLRLLLSGRLMRRTSPSHFAAVRLPRLARPSRPEPCPARQQGRRPAASPAPRPARRTRPPSWAPCTPRSRGPRGASPSRLRCEPVPKYVSFCCVS